MTAPTRCRTSLPWHCVVAQTREKLKKIEREKLEGNLKKKMEENLEKMGMEIKKKNLKFSFFFFNLVVFDFRPNSPHMSTLYVLELQHGKYYVGITNNLQRRFQQHLDGTGSAWTVEHPPVAVHRSVPLEGPLHEDRVTKQMMLDHGIENVRGGAYCKVELDDEQNATLTTEMRNAGGVCSRVAALDTSRRSVGGRQTGKGQRATTGRAGVGKGQQSAAKCAASDVDETAISQTRATRALT